EVVADVVVCLARAVDRHELDALAAQDAVVVHRAHLQIPLPDQTPPHRLPREMRADGRPHEVRLRAVAEPRRPAQDGTERARFYGTRQTRLPDVIGEEELAPE